MKILDIILKFGIKSLTKKKRTAAQINNYAKKNIYKVWTFER